VIELFKQTTLVTPHPDGSCSFVAPLVMPLYFMGIRVLFDNIYYAANDERI